MFVVALGAWWVAIKKNPEDKEHWSYWMFGMMGGSTLMFIMVFVHLQVNAPESSSAADAFSPTHVLDATYSLVGDSAKVLVPSARMKMNHALPVGSLQITATDVANVVG